MACKESSRHLEGENLRICMREREDRMEHSINSSVCRRNSMNIFSFKCCLIIYRSDHLLTKLLSDYSPEIFLHMIEANQCYI